MDYLKSSHLVRVLVVLVGAFIVGMTAPQPARAFAPCGSSSGCNYVPDGCGVGVNCVKKRCDSSLCPNPNGSTEDCWYCQRIE